MISSLNLAMGEYPAELQKYDDIRKKGGHPLKSSEIN